MDNHNSSTIEYPEVLYTPSKKMKFPILSYEDTKEQLIRVSEFYTQHQEWFREQNKEFSAEFVKKAIEEGYKNKGENVLVSIKFVEDAMEEIGMKGGRKGRRKSSKRTRRESSKRTRRKSSKRTRRKSSKRTRRKSSKRIHHRSRKRKSIRKKM